MMFYLHRAATLDVEGNFDHTGVRRAAALRYVDAGARVQRVEEADAGQRACADVALPSIGARAIPSENAKTRPRRE